MSTTQDSPTVFISHRHDDKVIADALREAIMDWSSDEITVIQSSHDKSGPRIGKPLIPELMDNLGGANVVILVYTVDDADWTYCMFECGVATDPKTEETSIVVLQCAEDVPAPLSELLHVKPDNDSIRQFTQEFHKDPEFFPRLGHAFSKDVSDETLKKRSDALFEALDKKVPGRIRREKRRWHYMDLAMQLDANEISGIRDCSSDQEALNLTQDAVEEKCFVKEGSPQLFPHFGFNSYQEDLKIVDLYRRWEEDPKLKIKHNWLSSVCWQIMLIVRNKPSDDLSVAFNSLSDRNRWYIPVVNRCSVGADGQDLFFRVELYRVTPAGDCLRVYNPESGRCVKNRTR